MIRTLLLIETGVVLSALLLVFGHAGRNQRRLRIRGPLVAAARQDLVQALGAESWAGPPERATALRRSEQVDLVLGTTAFLGGDNSDRLRRTADALGITARAYRRCRSRRWSRRLEGARVFTVIGGGQRVMVALLADPRAEVRAQAVEWVGRHPDPESIDRLVDLLDDPATLCRYTVKDSLLRLRAAATPAICHRLERGTGPLAELLEVAIWAPSARYLEPALQLSQAESPPIRAAALRLLGAVGGEQSQAAALNGLEDGAAEVRAAAAQVLGRAGHWPAAPRLGELLRDHSWDVRRAAGLALDAMGAPGQLVLRRSLEDSDVFAADMARLVLDVRAAATGGRA